MYIKESLGLLVVFCGLGVLSRPMDSEVGSCVAKSSDELLGDSQGADSDDYSSLDDDGSAQEAECVDPKAQADKDERKNAGEDKKEVDTNGEKFQETELAGESGIDKRESRYQLNDYPSCESKSFEDENVAKYWDAFGGFPQDSGRGKRVKRSFFYH